MEDVLKEASNVARKKNIKFLVLIQPSVIDLTVDNFQIGYKYYKNTLTIREQISQLQWKKYVL